MIHRAILGSVERMFAVLAEHCGGRWPLWLNPRAVAIIPVTDAHRAYAQDVMQRLKACAVRCSGALFLACVISCRCGSFSDHAHD
jgi:threonyl-tRNA synthetase